MCATCGCGDTHAHSHSHEEITLEHSHEEITLEQKVLAKNDQLAAINRAFLESQEITTINLMSSPGSGKTTLLERTIRELTRTMAVIEGDQETMLDAERIRSTGCPVVQINTGAGCHLDAAMLRDAIDRLQPERRALLFVENVGNLVCAALFDLGERGRVVVVSVTEGTDKPLKYPYMFAAADLVVVNKVDLLPYVDFDLAACRAYVASVNPKAEVLALSATRGDNLDSWYDWLAAV